MTKKHLKTISACLAVGFGLLSFPSCGKGDSLTTVKVNEVTHSIFYAPLYLADSLGYFKDENIKIELTNGGGADNVMSAVLSGDSHIGFCGPEAGLYVLIGGSTDVPTVFGQLTKRDGSFLVSRTPEPDFSWSNLEGKEILAGRKGGVPAMTFEYVLKQNNLFDGTNVTLNYDVAFNLMVSAFEAGTADYCTMFDPVAYEYEEAGKGYVVASVGEASGEVPYTCFMAKSSWLTKNKATAKGFLRAVMKAHKYIEENTPDTVAPYLTSYFEGTSVASISASVKRYTEIDSWQKGLQMQESSFNRLQDIIDNAGELSRRVEMQELVDNSLANEVYNEVYGS